MTSLRTSISILALTTSLTLCLAPKIALADDAPSPTAGAATAGQAIKENTEHRDDHLRELDRQREAAQANREKQLVKPQPTATPAPAPAPEATSTASWCWNGVCQIFKAATGIGTVEAIYDAVTKEPDEDAKQKRHKEEVHKEVEKRNAEKAKTEQSKTANAPKTTETKTADTKAVETKVGETRTSKAVAVPAFKPATKVLSYETPKAMTANPSRTFATIVHPTVSHPTIARPVVTVANVVRPTVNVPRPVVNVPTVRIPVIVAHR